MRDQIFISYSHHNRDWFERLKNFLTPLGLAIWDDQQIQPGDKWRVKIEGALAHSRAAILLVTNEFLASTFIRNNELPPLLEAAEREGMRIFWIYVSACPYRLTTLASYQAAHDVKVPLDRLSLADQNWELNQIVGKLEGLMDAPRPVEVDQARTSNLCTSGVESEPDAAAPAADLSCAKVVIVYKRNSKPDETVLDLLSAGLQKRQCTVYCDRELKVGMKWIREIEGQLRTADAVIALLSEGSVSSEMFQRELETVNEALTEHGTPRLIPVRVNYDKDLPDSIAAILHPIQQFYWRHAPDTPRLLRDIESALLRPPERSNDPPPVGGVEPLDSPYYIVRDIDREFLAALQRRDSIVLIKGARQMGKTSALARCLDEFTKPLSPTTPKILRTDLQKLNTTQFASLETFYLALMDWILDQMKIRETGRTFWDPDRAPNINLENFLTDRVLSDTSTTFVWAIDEADRLFTYPYANDFFGLIRTWHNDRGKRGSVWKQMTVAIAYATEAHLFITDPYQSPFNVGTKLELKDFDKAQVRELNRRYGSPLRTNDLDEFYELLSGQPFLVRRALGELKTKSFSELGERAAMEEGPFGDHLHRMLVLLARDTALCGSVRSLLFKRKSIIPLDHFYRLRSAGLIVGDSAAEARIRCQLYTCYLTRHLEQSVAEGR